MTSSTYCILSQVYSKEMFKSLNRHTFKELEICEHNIKEHSILYKIKNVHEN